MRDNVYILYDKVKNNVTRNGRKDREVEREAHWVEIIVGSQRTPLNTDQWDNKRLNKKQGLGTLKTFKFKGNQ